MYPQTPFRTPVGLAVLLTAAALAVLLFVGFQPKQTDYLNLTTPAGVNPRVRAGQLQAQATENAGTRNRQVAVLVAAGAAVSLLISFLTLQRQRLRDVHDRKVAEFEHRHQLTRASTERFVQAIEHVRAREDAVVRTAGVKALQMLAREPHGPREEVLAVLDEIARESQTPGPAKPNEAPASDVRAARQAAAALRTIWVEASDPSSRRLMSALTPWLTVVVPGAHVISEDALIAPERRLKMMNDLAPAVVLRLYTKNGEPRIVALTQPRQWLDLESPDDGVLERQGDSFRVDKAGLHKLTLDLNRRLGTSSATEVDTLIRQNWSQLEIALAQARVETAFRSARPVNVVVRTGSPSCSGVAAALAEWLPRVLPTTQSVLVPANAAPKSQGEAAAVLEVLIRDGECRVALREGQTFRVEATDLRNLVVDLTERLGVGTTNDAHRRFREEWCRFSSE